MLNSRRRFPILTELFSIMKQYDLIVVGGGSGGAGAAITAGRAGLRTLWIEKERHLGGAGVNALVNVWQPAYSAGELAPEIFYRLFCHDDAILTAPQLDTPSGHPIYRQKPDTPYVATLRRWDNYAARLIAPAVVYTPQGMDAVVREMAADTGNIELRNGAVFLDAKTIASADGLRRIASILVQTDDGIEQCAGGFFIDAAADIPLAIRAGCAWTMGREAAHEYNEPSAPAEREYKLNGWTLCFVIQPGPDRMALPAANGRSDGDWAHISALPGGGFNVNLCFQLSGEMGWALGHEQARDYLLQDTANRWPHIQRAYGLEEYGISEFAPRIGVREGPRLVARYVLTERDFHAGGFGAQHDDCIAFCDHAMDRHSPDGGCTEAEAGPFGIPFRCLQPREIDNLLVACRGAGFSSLAASAARLQRTMLDIGEAAARFVISGQTQRPERPVYHPWQLAQIL